METIYLEKAREIRKDLKNLREKLNVELKLVGKKLTIEGELFDEYEALRVIEAIQFGFSIKKSLTLLEPDTIFRILPIKNFTRRKDLYEVRSRVIGSEGKTKRAIENISGCELIVNEDRNQVGVIGSTTAIEEATTALTNLIKGSKQANVYAFLEKMNANKKELSKDLGLKTLKTE